MTSFSICESSRSTSLATGSSVDQPRTETGEEPEFSLYVPDFESRVGRVALEPDGRVWLKLQEWDASPQLNEEGRPLGVVPEEEEWLVVDPARGVVAEVRFPFGFRLQQVIGHRYLGIHVDEWGVESVHLYSGPAVGGG